MPPPENLSQRRSNKPEQLQELTNRLAAAWRNGESTDLEQFLPSSGNVLRPTVLHELIKTDLEMRWQRGQGVLLEYYLEKFPELGPAGTLSSQLIYEEFRVRRRHDKSLQVAAYRERFPAQCDELLRLDRQEVTGPSATPFTPGAMPTPGSQSSPSGQDFLPVGSGYKFIERIGSGGFGEVWRAEAPGGVEVAIKVLFRTIDHEEGQRELQSLKLIKRLRHPYLLSTQAYWAMQDRLYIVMELADGSLRDRLKECRKEGLHGIPPGELSNCIREAAEALDFLHRKEILHRDIKPENILLLQQHAKVADFGLARLAEGHRSVTATGSGTPAYMAPEMWASKACEQSDQYCLAITYAELRLDRRLFVGKDLMQLMMEHLNNTPDLVPLPEAEQKVLLRALAKEPKARFPNCASFAEALDQAVVPLLSSSEGNRSRRRLAEGVSAKHAVTTPPSEDEAQTDTVPPTKKEQQWRRPSPVAGTSDAPARSGPRRLLWTATLLLLVGLPLVLISRAFLSAPSQEPGEASFRLESPPSLVLKAGEAKTITVRIQRAHFTQPVDIAFQGVPAGVAMARGTVIPQGADHVEVSLTVDVNARPGNTKITLQAHAGELHQQATLALTIDPPESFWRPGWERPADARVVTDALRSRYFDRIDLVKDGMRIRFILIPKRTSEDPPTFYIMQDKVSVALFRRFAARDQSKDLHPVMEVSALEACRCARWLGGSLPTRRQWDKAAGRREPNRGEGPFKGPWDNKSKDQIAVNRGEHEPLLCGQASRDVSPFGCRDMAGNGREWTRDLGLDAGIVDDLLARTTDKLFMVLLRGRSFTAEEPLRYADLDRAEKTMDPDVKDYRKGEADIGFRVVIEPS